MRSQKSSFLVVWSPLKFKNDLNHHTYYHTEHTENAFVHVMYFFRVYFRMQTSLVVPLSELKLNSQILSLKACMMSL